MNIHRTFTDMTGRAGEIRQLQTNQITLQDRLFREVEATVRERVALTPDHLLVVRIQGRELHCYRSRARQLSVRERALARKPVRIEDGLIFTMGGNTGIQPVYANLENLCLRPGGEFDFDTSFFLQSVVPLEA